jgi:hypothetical protein
MSPGSVLRTSVLLALATLVLIPPPTSADAVMLEAVSTRPELVTGGDVLLRVTGLAEPTTLTVDGRQLVSTSVDTDEGGMLVLASGLPAGPSRIEATVAGDVVATLDVVNSAVTGPILSGPHLQPFICETTAAGLGEPLGGDCAAAPRIRWYYVPDSPGAAAVPLADPYAPYPPDMATTTTVDGVTVPFVLRLESRTINRAIAHMAVLDDPHARGPETPFRPTEGWNRRLVYGFGGGCSVSHRQGGRSDGYARPEEAMLTWLLADGYAQIVTSLNEGGVSCNDVLSAETAAMAKEHFVEAYGVPRWTMGRGGSGGAIQQLMVAQNYPGLLDGLVVRSMFPDNTTVAPDVLDCRILQRVFDSNPALFNEAARQAVTGYATSDTCATWNSVFAPSLDPAVCDPAVPAELVYDPASNPDGVRCTLQDGYRNVYGVDPTSGAAPSWYDNTGIQYGLQALRDLAITPQQFVALNAAVGGLDIDLQPTTARTRAPADTLATAYQSGRVVDGHRLGEVPIIDINYYVDHVPQFNVHDRVRSFMLRARLAHANGHADNHVMWTYGPTGLVYQPFLRPDADGAATDVMRAWLDQLTSDTSGDPLAERVVRSRPTAAADRCVPADFGPPVDGQAEFGGDGTCDVLFPAHATPRLVAGAPLTGDVLACKLRPVDIADYGAAAPLMTPDVLSQLHAVFPDGVCDHTRPGVGQAPAGAAWQRY